MDRKRRENEGLRLWPGFKGSLEAAVGHDVPEDRLSLSQTTLLRDAFLARLRSGRQVVTADAPTFDDILSPLEAARARAGALNVILLHHLDRSIGAIRVPSGAILASPQKLLMLLNGDLFVTTEGAIDGVALSALTQHVSRADDRTEYSLALWGRFVAD